MQIGHAKELWPLALLKELVDNALDACESAGIAPVIEVEVDENSFTVRDNGPGIPAKTLEDSLNYLLRVSDKSFYVSPTRGQQGNALKTVWAAPFVVNGNGHVDVWTRGEHHIIETSINRLTQKPKISHRTEPEIVKNGTSIQIYWPGINQLIRTETYYSYKFPEEAKRFIQEYAALNPHARFKIADKVFEPTDPTWKKWIPSDPTSPHWYTPELLRDLIAAYIVKERADGKAKTVREFVSEFRGLAGTAKQKEVVGNMAKMYLHDFVIESNDEVDMEKVSLLLAAMKKESSPPKPAVLGIIGKDHIKNWMIKYANAAEKSIEYRHKKSVSIDGLPHVAEMAFAVLNNDNDKRRIVSGLNWSPTLVLPAEEISALLQKMRFDPHDPVIVFFHIARPRFQFVDRGKTRLEL